MFDLKNILNHVAVTYNSYMSFLTPALAGWWRSFLDIDIIFIYSAIGYGHEHYFIYSAISISIKNV